MSAGRHGTLFLVVGPSGAGKDSLIEAARARLADDPRYWFPQRVITRPADAGGESHIEADPAAFEAMLQRGGLAIAWDSHGLRYGIPSEIAPRRAAGVHVVVNVSRGVVADCRARFGRLCVIHVSASREVLAHRLSARGRESAAEIAARLDRTSMLGAELGETVELDNSGNLETAITRFLRLLEDGSRGP